MGESYHAIRAVFDRDLCRQYPERNLKCLIPALYKGLYFDSQSAATRWIKAECKVRWLGVQSMSCYYGYHVFELDGSLEMFVKLEHVTVPVFPSKRDHNA